LKDGRILGPRAGNIPAQKASRILDLRAARILALEAVEGWQDTGSWPGRKLAS
jgi:hypothetical protein